MKKTLIPLILIIIFSCKKDDSLSILNGNWELVDIYVYDYSSNDYIGDWSKLIIDFDGDTLKYNKMKGDSFNDTTSYTYKEILYNLILEIDDNILVKCDFDDFESGVKRDTIFTTTFVEDDFDFTLRGGGKYDLRIEFGKNGFYILGPSDYVNVLYAIKDEIVKDTLVLKSYNHDYQSSTYLADYKYTFHKTSH